ncbi:MAG: type II toxin-antitoxin system VapC family toxin [Actinobacteria bacterium]|nr:type II toxin-antitoxin system VapC family toxin [Actinomycetota bacterium]MBL7060675.1 type II toxin-antitoxin system VapC family toxin [Actinomycetota bacterium]
MFDVLHEEKKEYNIQYLFDSDIIIDILKNDIYIINYIKKLKIKNSNFFYSPVSKAEIFAGAFKDEFDKINLFFNQLTCIQITDRIGEQSGLFLNQYSKSHNIGLGDVLIAATAFYYDLYLLTRNVKHYPMPEVRVVKP